MALEPTTVAPYRFGAEWDINVPGHIETVFVRALNATLDALPLDAASLRSVLLELWTLWRSCISTAYVKPARLVALFPDGSYAAIVDAPLYSGPSGSDAAMGLNRSTCLLIRGAVEPYPADELRASCYWLIQSWGHYPLAPGRRRYHRSELAGVSDVLAFLDGHPYLWADKYGRKATCLPTVEVFAHPQIQRHFWLPTPPP